MKNNYIGAIKFLAAAVFIIATSTAFAKQDIVVGSFNIKNYGITKASNPAVLKKLVDIISRYDIAFLQELRNKDEQYIYKLKYELDRRTGITHKMILTLPLGRSTYKEQYAYIYNPNKVRLVDSYVYDDGEEPYFDTFSREPFIAQFESTETKYRFATIGSHLAPKDSKAEIDELYKVYESVAKKWKTRGVILMGDLNADCDYIEAEDEALLLLRRDSRFTWWIERGQDTTVAENTTCGYDKIITAGEITNHIIYPANVFNFSDEFGLEESEAKKISDHYPVEVTLTI